MITATLSLPSFASAALCAASNASMPFTTFIAPFIPALVGVVVALILESAVFWFDRAPQMNWWFTLAFGTIAVFLLIWDSWSRGVPMVALAEAPDAQGLEFRLVVLGFGLAVSGTVLFLTYAGVRTVLAEMAMGGPFVGVLRLLPATAIPILLMWHVRAAVRIFEGITFTLFP